MIRFLHTADWHLGIKYTKLGHSAQKAREVRIETAKKLMNIAKDNNVDFIIIAGDLFDNNDVDRRLVDIAVKIMGDAEPIPVYILPGNHDPLTRDSLYLNQQWYSLDNTFILKNNQPVEIPGINVTLYPCPVTQKQTRRDLTEWIKLINNNISVGIAHGNLQIPGWVNEPNFPIDPERAEKSGLDYLALGEWHSLFKYKEKDNSFRAVYPGTPETTKFGEKNSGKAAIVKIEEHGAKPIVKEIDVGGLKWEEWVRDVSAIEDIKSIERELNNVKNREHRVVTLYVKGVIDPEGIDYLESIDNQYSKEFLYFNLVQKELYLKPNLSKLKAIIPEGAVFAKACEAIESLMRCHPTLQEYTQIPAKDAQGILKDIGGISSAVKASPEILQRALLLLYKMAKEASK